MLDAKLAQLPPLDIAPLLDKLLSISSSSKDDSGSPPRVTLHLKTGESLSGILLAKAAEPGSTLITFQRIDSQHGADSGSVTYLALSAIEAVTVHNAALLVHYLSDGRIPAPDLPGREAPSRLQLKRRGEELAALLQSSLSTSTTAQVSWEKLPESTEGRRNAARLLEDVFSALQHIAGRDSMGKEAAGSILEVRFLQAAGSSAALDGAVLKISANMQAGAAGRFSSADLIAEIEKVL